MTTPRRSIVPSTRVEATCPETELIINWKAMRSTQELLRSTISEVGSVYKKKYDADKYIQFGLTKSQ